MEGSAAADDSDETNSSKREMAALNELKSELVTSITPNHLLPHLKCLTSPDCENIKARERTEGARAGATLLLELIVKKQDWYSDLLSALRDDDISLGHLADRLENAFDEKRQRTTSSVRKRREPNSQGSSFAIYVRYVKKQTSARIMCEEGETIFDLCNKISEEIKEFRLHDDDMRMFETPHREIVIYKETKRDRKSHIGKQHPYPSRQPLKELKDTDLVFNILVSERISMGEIDKQCCGQKILLFGPDRHGKSATINTFFKVCDGRYRPLASTLHTGAALNRQDSLSPLTSFGPDRFDFLEINGLSVSGEAEKEKTRKTVKKAIKGKLKKNHHVHASGRRSWFSRNIGKCHAVLYVHNSCSENCYELLSMLVEELDKAGDRAIPLFVILTHCDEDDEDSRVYHDVLQKGIAASRVFRISNNHQDKYEAQHPTAHQHTLSALWKILSVSKIFKEDGRVPLENEKQEPSNRTSGFRARIPHCVIS